MALYLRLLVFFLTTILLSLILYGVALLLRKKPIKETAKSKTYECGEIAEGPAWIRFHAGYYAVAILFILFDIETLFLFPWATVLKKLGTFALIEMFVFIIVLLFGWFYAYKKGDIEWT